MMNKLLALALLAITIPAYAQFPSTSDIAGNYSGTTQLGEACEVEIKLKNDFFGREYIDISATTKTVGTITLKSVAVQSLDRKLASDTDFRRKNDKNFDAAYMVVGFYTAQSLGHRNSVVDSMHISWFNEKVSTVSLVEKDSSTSFFRIHDGRSILCQNLR